VTISGLGTCLPDRVVTNDDLTAALNTSDQWIRQRTGIGARRVADPEVAASDLAVPAARQALQRAGVGPEAVGLVLVASISHDQPLPSTASRVAYELGATQAGACDLSAGCAGFVYGLALAAAAVAAGLHEHVLIVGAEITTRILDWQDRRTAVLFGDAAGAAVVSPAHGAGRILGFDLANEGSGAELLTIPAGGSRLPASEQTVAAGLHYLKMKGSEVYRFGTRLVPDSARRVLAAHGRTVDELDLFVPHQANLRIIEGAVAKLGIAPDKVYTNLERYGNTSCASIPLCLSEARDEGRLRDGDLVLLMGFGAGLTWGSCLLEWGSS